VGLPEKKPHKKVYSGGTSDVHFLPVVFRSAVRALSADSPDRYAGELWRISATNGPTQLNAHTVRRLSRLRQALQPSFDKAHGV
jgi:hypothetical protein